MSRWIKDKDGRHVRSEPVTVEQALASAQRLVNSHFKNEDRAICRIPVHPDDDDIVVTDYIRESAQRIDFLEKALQQATRSALVREATVWDMQPTGTEIVVLLHSIERSENCPELVEWLKKRKKEAK